MATSTVKLGGGQYSNTALSSTTVGAAITETESRYNNRICSTTKIYNFLNTRYCKISLDNLYANYGCIMLYSTLGVYYIKLQGRTVAASKIFGDNVPTVTIKNKDIIIDVGAAYNHNSLYICGQVVMIITNIENSNTPYT